MSQEIDLLTKLYDFYSKRYKGSNLEEKFNTAVYDLVKTGDVQKSTYMEFCVEHDIEPLVAPRPVVVAPAAPQQNYYDDGCGGGGRGNYQRSSC
jgi:hypothetical protein